MLTQMICTFRMVRQMTALPYHFEKWYAIRAGSAAHETVLCDMELLVTDTVTD